MQEACKLLGASDFYVWEFHDLNEYWLISELSPGEVKKLQTHKCCLNIYLRDSHYAPGPLQRFPDLETEQIVSYITSTAIKQKNVVQLDDEKKDNYNS